MRRLDGGRGFALVAVLVLTAVLALCSAAAMRSLLQADTVILDQRSRVQADEAARLALRWCEARVLDPDDPMVPLAAAASGAAPAWTQPAAWAGNLPVAQAVPPDWQSTPGGGAPPPAQCLAQDGPPSPVPLRRVLLTARGFSNDYAGEDGAMRAGAQAWLQTELLLGPAGWADAGQPPPPCALPCPEEVLDRVTTPLASPPLH